ncbi:MAG: alpha/beta hydrolase [Bacteroidetes bacterium]|nr:alpha/beta hydrolase [Bacteroidota bacterium]
MDTSTIKLPKIHRLFLEPLGISELVNIIPAKQILDSLPHGDGQPVMIIPGLTTGDWSTKIIRTFLKSKGFYVYGWGQGLNVKYTQDLEDRLKKRIDKIYDRHQRKVTLIGWSLGGLTIRVLAKSYPDKIRQLISLGGPFKSIEGKSYVTWWYELLAQERVKNFNPIWKEAASTLPEHPSTSIYSKTDGMVSWEYCMDWETSPTIENIEVRCNHLGFGMNPTVWQIVHDRIMQPDDEWQPFDVSTIHEIESTALFHI